MVSSTQTIPRATYAVAMGCATLVALGLSVMVAMAMSGSSQSLLGVVIGVLACSAAMVIPMMGPPLVTPDRWGMVVLGCTGVRTMIGLGGMLLLSQAFPGDKKAIVFAILTGTMILIGAEGLVAVWLLARQDARVARSRGHGTNTHENTRQGPPRTGQTPRSTT